MTVTKGKPKGLKISAREEAILDLLATGLSVPRMARVLSCSEGTVRSHLLRMRAKTGAINRLGLLVFALHNGYPRSRAAMAASQRADPDKRREDPLVEPDPNDG